MLSRLTNEFLAGFDKCYQLGSFNLSCTKLELSSSFGYLLSILHFVFNSFCVCQSTTPFYSGSKIGSVVDWHKGQNKNHCNKCNLLHNLTKLSHLQGNGIASSFFALCCARCCAHRDTLLCCLCYKQTKQGSWQKNMWSNWGKKSTSYLLQSIAIAIAIECAR